MLNHDLSKRLKSALGWFLVLSLVIAPLLFFSTAVSAATVTIQPPPADSQDTWIASINPDYNYENNGIMRIGNISESEFAGTAYILIRFDLTGQPAPVTSAILQLVLYEPPEVVFAIDAHRITSAWEVDTVTWNAPPAYEATAAATTTGSGTPESVWEWDVTTLYNQWQSGTANYGMLLKNAPDSDDSVMGFCESMNETPEAWYPKLVLTYDENPAYTVTFNSVGGSTVASASVPSGALVTKPADPVLAGFMMDGWFRESTYDTEWDFETDTVEGNITLYAKWVPQPTPTLSPTPTPTVAPTSTPTPTPTPEVIPDTGEHPSRTLPAGLGVLLIGGVLLVITRSRFPKKRSQ